MLEYKTCGITLPQAYHDALYELRYFGAKSECSDWNTTQTECAMTMVVKEPLTEPMISRCFIGGAEELQQYVMEMVDGILDFEVGRGNWKYTYHMRYKDQIGFVEDELRRNPSSRRAVMVIRDKMADMYSDDPACLQTIQYFVREGKLDCMVLFRSNDACKATFMNAFALIMLQKRIADELGVPVGTYSHRANSFHCYEKDWPLLKGYVDRIEKSWRNQGSVVYNYEGDWREDMEDAIPTIMEKVKTLKEN